MKGKISISAFAQGNRMAFFVRSHRVYMEVTRLMMFCDGTVKKLKLQFNKTRSSFKLKKNGKVFFFSSNFVTAL